MLYIAKKNDFYRLFPNDNINVFEIDKVNVKFNFKQEMKAIVLIEEQFNKTIKLVLNEKLHISDDVINTKNTISTQIQEYFKTIKTQNLSAIDGIKYYNNSFVYNNIFGSDINLTINYTIYIVPNNGNEYEILSRLPLTSNVKCSECTLNLKSAYFTIDGFDVRSFDDALQHELEHFYQFIKKGGTDLIKNRKMYDIALKNLKSRDNDGFNKILADIVYLSYKQEGDGYLNGAYATIMWAEPKTKQEVDYWFERTEIMQALKLLQYNRQNIIENINNENLLNALKDYGKTTKWLLRISDYAIKHLSHKIQGVKKLCYERIKPNF